MSKDIVIYGSNACHHCTDAKKYLESKKVSYRFIELTEDTPEVDKALKRIEKNGSISMPTICDESGVSVCVIGFNPHKIDKLLNQM